MKRILTSPAAFIRQLPIAPHDAIANRTLNLPLHRTIHISLKRGECIDQAPVEDGNRAEGCAKPGLPFRFGDGDAVDGVDVGVCEGKGRREGNSHGHCLLVNEVGGCDFAGAGRDFDGERRVRVVLELFFGPGGDRLQCGGDDGWRYLMGGQLSFGEVSVV
jgi:hypothetical protein